MKRADYIKIKKIKSIRYNFEEENSISIFFSLFSSVRWISIHLPYITDISYIYYHSIIANGISIFMNENITFVREKAKGNQNAYYNICKIC